MSRVDMHVHSKYSNHPSEWFLQRLGASESYTEPEFIYRSAKEKGMDFVTVTDHNRADASLWLKERYPDDCFTGVESTAYFPEDGCKVHILIYGFNEDEFEEIQRFRKNIYDLCDYLKEKRLPHSLAHATYSVNKHLSVAHIEKLLLLFDVFEGINGGRNSLHNETWMSILTNLNPETLDDLRRKHRIEPVSDTSWVKGITGGSDDHAGLFIGQAYTMAEAKSHHEFLDAIRNRKSHAGGRHNDYKSLAFMFYKIAYDFYRHKTNGSTSSPLSKLTEFIFEKRKPGLKDRLLFRRLKSSLKKDSHRVHQLVSALIDEVEDRRHSPLDEQIDFIYKKIAEIADEFLGLLLQSLEKDVRTGDLGSLIRNLSASLPGIFLSAPFFSTIRILTDNRRLLSDLRTRFGKKPAKRDKTILWFTDTIDDLNGVSITLQKIGNLAMQKELPLFIVSAARTNEEDQGRPPIKAVHLPTIYSFRLPGYETYVMKVPSILRSLEQIYNANPEEIIISTPGPIGILGLLAARLLHIKTVGIFHTDFTLQVRKLISDESVSQLLERLVRTFYSAMDEIRVPTQEYIRILESRGFDLSKMKIFPRAIDAEIFAPRPGARDRLKQKFGLKDGFNLLYVGRISKDKELPFLLSIYEHLLHMDDQWNLLIVGDGPYRRELQEKARRYERIRITGRVDYESLPEFYSAADILVFPSTTDTFGMVVLEAQACGLPAIVSDRGGPKEIIEDHKTGLIATAGSIDSWLDKIVFMRTIWQTNPRRFSRMKEEARRRIQDSFSWECIIREMLDEKKESPLCLRQQQCPESNGRSFSQYIGRIQV
ncbi:MAG: glycosyltransferase [Candidatus Aminicenantales bacterium]